MLRLFFIRTKITSAIYYAVFFEKLIIFEKPKGVDYQIPNVIKL